MHKNFRKSIFGLLLILLVTAGYSVIAEKEEAGTTWWNNIFGQEAPIADFNFSPNNVCANTPIKFTNTSSGTALSYSWNFGDGSPASTLKDPTHTFNAVGGGTKTFTVTLTVTEDGVSPVTVSKQIIIKETPDLTVGSDQNQKDFEGLPYFVSCTNQDTEFLFLNQSTTKASNIKYTIDWGDGSPIFTSSDWSSEKHFYKRGIYQVTYTIESANGCTLTKKFGVFVGSNPAVGLATPGNTNICTGEPLTFTITGTENNPVGTIYKVSFSDGSPDQVFSHPPPATVTHIYERTSCGELSNETFKNYFAVKILATNPCESSVAQVEPIYVTEPVDPEIKVPTAPVCVGQSALIENISDLFVDASNSGACSETGKFVWEITPSTGWTIAANTLGERPIPSNTNTWSSGSKTINPVFQSPGTYTIKLITGNKCGIRETTETICVIPSPVASFTVAEKEVCGPATVSFVNTSNILGLCGTSNPNSFTWSVNYSNSNCGTNSDWEFTGGTDKNSESANLQFNTPGIYTVRLTIAASCGQVSKTETITVTAPPAVTISDVPNSCGPITFTPKATVNVCGTETPTYKWTFEGGIPANSSNPDPGPVSFSSPGSKKIKLEVTSSCGTTVSEKVFTVTNPPSANAGTDQEICNGEEIILTGTASGGTGPFTYQWTSVPTSPISNGNTASPIIKPNQTTIYTLTVLDQSSNCVSTDEVEIKVIPAPVIQFDLPNQEICSGQSSQLVTLSSTPPGEIITWTSEANGILGVPATGTNEIPVGILSNPTSNPIDVVFTAKIESASQGNCNVVPAKYIIRVNPTPDYSDENLVVCSDQAFDFRPSDFITGSKFSWTVNAPSGITGASNSTQESNSIAQQLTNTTNSPIEVTYLITPKLGDCIGSSFKLDVSVQPSPSILFSEPDQSLCTGGVSKPVILSSTVVGATFSWTADANGALGVTFSGSGNEIPAQTLSNPTNQPITVEYKISVNTSGGGNCAGVPKIYKITVNPSVSLSEEISDFNGYEISCHGANDGAIKLNPSGGNGVFTYSWSGPQGFFSTAKEISNLKPGTYQVDIADEFGCAISESYEIREPLLLQAGLISTKDILCAGDESGEIEISTSGGVSSLPYQFEWKRNGTLIPENSQNLSGIPAGVYEVKVIDANGCFTILPSIKLSEPEAQLFIDYSKTDISCFGANDGSLDLNVSGGKPPYSIKWEFGSSQSGFTNLGPGDYTLTVSDQSGCIRTQTITIEDAPLFRSTPEVNQISCFGKNDGSIKLNLEGGVGTTTIRWDNGQELENLFNLPSGFYGVTIKDETDCEIRQEFNIVEPALLQLEPKVTDALGCINTQSGEISLGITGGTPPYTIQWSNGSTSELLTGITSGQYAVTVKDASGCSINQSFEVKRPPTLNIIGFRSTNVQCSPRSIEERVQITVTGGVAPYTIQWSGGNVSTDGKTMVTDTPGLYEVTVTDGKGCIKKESFEVESLEVIPEAEIESAAFEQYNSYLVNFEIQFWNKSFGQITSYFWDFGDGSESFEENPKHTYSAEGEYEVTLKVTDIFGCSSEVKKKISVFDYYLVVPNAFTPNGDGINDYFFPKFLNIESLQFWVLNKWGETIFYTEDLNNNGWNGKIGQNLALPGNYVYKLKFKTLDGRTQTQTDLFMLLK